MCSNFEFICSQAAAIVRNKWDVQSRGEAQKTKVAVKFLQKSNGVGLVVQRSLFKSVIVPRDGTGVSVQRSDRTKGWSRSVCRKD